MLFLNLIFFLSLRDTDYLLFVTLVVAYAFFASLQNGTLAEYILTSFPGIYTNVIPLGAFGLYIGLLLVTEPFLNTKKHFPKTNIILKYIKYIGIASLTFHLFLSYTSELFVEVVNIFVFVVLDDEVSNCYVVVLFDQLSKLGDI